MKASIYTLALLLVGMTSLQAQSTKTITKSISLDGASSLTVKLEGTVTTQYWNQSYAQVITTIEVENMKETTLKNLISAGRYDIETKLDKSIMSLAAPKAGQKVTIGGVQLSEKVTYTIMVPEGFPVSIGASGQSAVLENKSF